MISIKRTVNANEQSPNASNVSENGTPSGMMISHARKNKRSPPENSITALEHSSFPFGACSTEKNKKGSG